MPSKRACGGAPCLTNINHVQDAAVSMLQRYIFRAKLHEPHTYQTSLTGSDQPYRRMRPNLQFARPLEHLQPECHSMKPANTCRRLWRCRIQSVGNDIRQVRLAYIYLM